MKDFDVYELNTAEEIDAAFAKTFGLKSCQWADGFDQDAVTDFLEGLTGQRHVRVWSIELRNWYRGHGHDYECYVSSERQHRGGRIGVKGYGFSDYAAHGLMKAAIEWDQRRRSKLRKGERDA